MIEQRGIDLENENNIELDEQGRDRPQRHSICLQVDSAPDCTRVISDAAQQAAAESIFSIRWDNSRGLIR